MPFSKSSYHIGTSQLTCIAIAFTVFYMTGIFTEKYFPTDYSCSSYSCSSCSSKWLSVRLRIKWLWVRIPLQSLVTSIYSKRTTHIFERNFSLILNLTSNFINQLSENFLLKNLCEIVKFENSRKYFVNIRFNSIQTHQNIRSSHREVVCRKRSST